jgi:hypothetical protein
MNDDIVAAAGSKRESASRGDHRRAPDQLRRVHQDRLKVLLHQHKEVPSVAERFDDRMKGSAQQSLP